MISYARGAGARARSEETSAGVELSAKAHHTRVISIPTALETRWGSPLSIHGLALVLALGIPAPGIADELYSFVDGNGVIHYTNVPDHPGYAVIAGTKQRGGRKGGVTAHPPLRQTSEFDDRIRLAAQKYGLAPPLVKAVMAAESNFDPAAISMKGATGLMQLMPETAREMFVHDAFDPAQNIDGGARYLRQLHDQFGGVLELVLAAYNAGPERVLRSGGKVPAIPETQAYVRKVLGLYEAYRTRG